MHQSVIDRFVDFTVPLEGRVLWMYLDVLGLVTTGVGNLIDPVGAALQLPWKLPDGSLAPKDLVQREWQALKARKDLAKMHYKYAATITTVRLTEEDVTALVRSKLLSNEKLLKQAFPHWDNWPADAQLFASSMAWAVGPGWPKIFGNCSNFLRIEDWENASLCAAIKTEGNPGIIPRNAQNRLCLANALAVTEQHLDPETLYWPEAAHAEDKPIASEAKAELDLQAAKHAISIGEWAFNQINTGHHGPAHLDEDFDSEHPTDPAPPPDEEPNA